MKTQNLNAKLNKRERRAQQLLAHYATCERLARHLGASNPDGKKISVALWNLERIAHAGATAQCNGERFQCRFHVSGKLSASMPWEFDFCANEEDWDRFSEQVANQMRLIFGTAPAGFFVNGDARGYALKIDPDNAAGRELIEACQLHTDWGRNGILSPEITGDL